jgi:hypothetical protein
MKTKLSLVILTSVYIYSICDAQQFTRIYIGDHVNDGGSSWGACWIDYDNDGYPDIFITNLNMNNDRNCLYHNETDGTFVKILNDIIVTDSAGWGGGCSWGDYDNDGYIDAVVVNWDPNNNLYRNNGDGSFSKITEGVIPNETGMSVSASWTDYDNDGDLDLYVTKHAGHNTLYRNDGSSFFKITTGEIVTDTAESNNASWADYDNDGDVDMFVANGLDNPQNRLYENNGDGTFTKITNGVIVDDSESMGGSWGDYDNDGDLDLFVARPIDLNNLLYENNGNGDFIQITGQEIVTDGGNSSGSCWGDYDNDGDLDLFVANGEYFNRSVNFLYENDGDGNFIRITQGEIATDLDASNGAAWGDYDLDGDLDLFVTNTFNFSENNAMYRNNGSGNNWISIKCSGVYSNASAIGTKVRIKSSINGYPIWQMREISAQTGKNGQNSLNAHIGLGDAPTIDSLKIEWPSGLVEIDTDININQHLVILEGSLTGISFNNFEPEILGNLHVYQNAPNPFNSRSTIGFILTLPSDVIFEVYDLLGRKIKTISKIGVQPGTHQIIWDAKDHPSGIYFYKIQVEGHSETKKMLLLK